MVASYTSNMFLVIDFFRGVPENGRSPLDLCIGVFRASPNTSQPQLVAYVSHSKRQVASTVSCTHVLEPGNYIIGKGRGLIP